MVDYLFMVQWAIRLIPDGGPTELFLVPASSSCAMCYPICAIVLIKKEPLLLIEKSSSCNGGSQFPL